MPKHTCRSKLGVGLLSGQYSKEPSPEESTGPEDDANQETKPPKVEFAFMIISVFDICFFL